MHTSELYLVVDFSVAAIAFVMAVAVAQCRFATFFRLPPMNRWLATFALTTAVWSLMLGLSVLYRDIPWLAEFFARATWSGGFICYSFFMLAMTLVEDRRPVLWAGIQGGLSLLFFVLGFTRFGIREVASVLPLQRVGGPAAVAYRGWVIISVCYAVWVMVRYYRRLPADTRASIRGRFGLSLVLFFGGAAVMGAFGAFGVDGLLHVTAVGSLLWLSGFLLAVERGRLINLSVVFSDALRFVLFTTVNVAGMYLMLGLGRYLLLSETEAALVGVGVLGVFWFMTPLREAITAMVRSFTVRRKNRAAELIQETARELADADDLQAALERTLNRIVETVGPVWASVYVREDGRATDGAPTYRRAASAGLHRPGSEYLRNPRIIRWLERNQEPFVLNAAWHGLQRRVYNELAEGMGSLGGAVLVPVMHAYQVVAVLAMDQRRADGSILDIEDIELMRGIARHLAVMIHHGMLHRELDDTCCTVVAAFANLYESKRDFLQGHARHVATLAEALGGRLGYSDAELHTLSIAAVLHDIGKFGISDEVLTKPGPLTDEEWTQIREHPVRGAELLERFPFLADAARIVRSHHERYDGTGYPDRIAGPDIPRGARILAVANAVDAMVSGRPYRERSTRRLSPEEVRAELQRFAATQFDPEIVQAFLGLADEHPGLLQEDGRP
jgi:putative nucleotidyltransferase with HDIG domain